MFSDTNLIWIDLEMTGLRPEADRILEIATVVTDQSLVVVEEGPVFAVRQSEDILAGMDEWNQTHHSESGLLKRVREKGVPEAEAAEKTLAFLRRLVPEAVSPMCGNSICQDRRFLYRYMPALEKYFHYRNLDVSSLKILAERWAPEVFASFEKREAHLALADIHESIDELRHYRDHLIRIPAN